jgi:hypothetical protein
MPKAMNGTAARPKRPPGSPVVAPEGKGFEMMYPTLFRFLEDKRPSQNRHKTGTISMFYEDSRWKLCLNDRPNARSCFVSSERLGDAFRIADNGIQSNTLLWRTKGYKTAGERKLFADPS